MNLDLRPAKIVSPATTAEASACHLEAASVPVQPRNQSISFLTAEDDHHEPATSVQPRSKLILPDFDESDVRANDADGSASYIKLVATGEQPDKPKSKLLPLPPIPKREPKQVKFEPSFRTRLAPVEEATDGKAFSGSGMMGIYLSFYRKCPACRSEEVYAMASDGKFPSEPRQLSWVKQRMFCERCTRIYNRPGRLFCGPKPSLRPADSALYDN
jgi:hypothetical protein